MFRKRSPMEVKVSGSCSWGLQKRASMRFQSLACRIRIEKPGSKDRGQVSLPGPVPSVSLWCAARIWHGDWAHPKKCRDGGMAPLSRDWQCIILK